MSFFQQAHQFGNEFKQSISDMFFYEEHSHLKTSINLDAKNNLVFDINTQNLSSLDRKTLQHFSEDLTANNVPFIVSSEKLEFTAPCNINELSSIKDILREHNLDVSSNNAQIQNYFTTKSSELKLSEPAYKNFKLYRKATEIFDKIRTLNQQDRHVGYDITKAALGLSLIVLPTGLDYESKGTLKEGIMNMFKLYNDPSTRPLFSAQLNNLESSLKDIFSSNHKVDLTQNLNKDTKVTFDFDTSKNMTFVEFNNVKLPESQFEKSTHLVQREIQRKILGSKIVNNKIYFETSKQNLRVINDILNKKNLNINHVPNQHVLKALSDVFITSDKQTQKETKVKNKMAM